MASPQQKSTRSRKTSLKDTPSSSSISDLIRESEERLKEFFKTEMSLVTQKLSKIETALSAVQTQCLRLDSEVSEVKEVIFKQQTQIEAHERKLRERNLIIHNIPETHISTATEQLKDDSDKIQFLCRSADINIKKADLVSLRRLGRNVQGKSRPLKIELTSTDQKFKILNQRKNITRNQVIQTCFQTKVFVNPDNSFLIQKEEHRLRQELKEYKECNPSRSYYIRSGVLYHDNKMIDRINIRNQLF